MEPISMEWSDSGEAEKRAKRKPRLPSGIKFMPHTGMKRLVRTLKKEKDFKTRCKLMACKMRKEGSTIQHICDFLGLPYSTVRDWLGYNSRPPCSTHPPPTPWGARPASLGFGNGVPGPAKYASTAARGASGHARAGIGTSCRRPARLRGKLSASGAGAYGAAVRGPPAGARSTLFYSALLYSTPRYSALLRYLALPEDWRRDAGREDA